MARWMKSESLTMAPDGRLQVVDPVQMMVASGDCIGEFGESYGVIRVTGGIQIESVTVVCDSLVQIIYPTQLLESGENGTSEVVERCSAIWVAGRTKR
jgi:hypothetical protein